MVVRKRPAAEQMAPVHVLRKRPASEPSEVSQLKAISIRNAPPLRTLVINLKRRPDRWLRVSEAFAPQAASGLLQIEQYNAVDGSKESIPEEEVTLSWCTKRNARYDTSYGGHAGVTIDMSPGERGCAASHIRAWKEVAQSETPVLILEDDAVPYKAFTKRLEARMSGAAGAGADVLYLGYIQGAPWRAKLANGLYEAEYLWTTVAYVLWPSGARKLLDLLPANEPVDNFMGAQIAAGQLRGLVCVPELVKQELEWGAGSDVVHSDEVYKP